MKPNGLLQPTILIAHSTLTLDAGAAHVLSCVATMDSDTLWYQLESEYATTHTEISLPQVLGSESFTSFYVAGTSIISANISATPLMLVWEASDLVASATPGTVSTPLPPTATVATNEHQESHPSLSDGAVAAISTSAALSVILIIAACLFYRASKRRSSKGNPQPEMSAEKTSQPWKPDEEVKPEMEDPLSAQGLLTQSGAYQGKPELGSEVNKPCEGNPDNADTTISPIIEDRSAEGPSPGDETFSVPASAEPAELG